MMDGPVKKNPAKVSMTGSPEGTPPDWMAGVQAAYAVHNIVASRPELPFWLLRLKGGGGSFDKCERERESCR